MRVHNPTNTVRIFAKWKMALPLLCLACAPAMAQQVDDIVVLPDVFNVVEGSSVTDTKTFTYVDESGPDVACSYTINVNQGSEFDISVSPLSGVCEDGINDLADITVGAGTAVAGSYEADLGVVTVTETSVQGIPTITNYGVVILVEVAQACDVPGLEDLPADDPACVATNTPPQITSGPTASPNPASVGETVSFTVEASDAETDTGLLEYSWNFGDGQTVVGQTPTHVYAAAGTYPVTVTVSDGELSATATVDVVVNALPTDSTLALGFVDGNSVIQADVSSPGVVEVRVKNIVDGEEIPAAGVEVVWITSSDALSADPQSSVSNELGIAQTTVTSSEIGEFTLTARAQDAELEFTILVSLPDTTVADTPAAATESAIFDACPDAENNEATFQDTCNAIVGASDGERNAAINQLQNDEIANQKRTLESVIAQQGSNLRARLAALRAGATGISLRGLTFNLNGIQVPGEVLLAATNNVGTGPEGDIGGLLGNRLGIFATGTLSYGDKDATDRAAGFEFDTKGITVGADYRFTEQFVAGAALGFATTDVDLDDDGGELDTDSFTIALFGSYYPSDRYYLEGHIGYGDAELDQVRNADFTIAGQQFDTSFEADPDAEQFFASLGGGYDFVTDGGLTLTLLGRIDYLDADIDSYRESEPGGLTGMAVEVDSQNVKSLTSNIGAQIQQAFSQNWGVLVPFARVEWIHEFENDTPVISGSFIGNTNPDAGNLRFFGEDVDEDYARLGLGVTGVFKHGLSGFISYDKVLGFENYDQTDWNLGLRYEVAF